MGHPRRAEAAPSPVQLLAIFQAKEKGIPLPEISRRTKYAVSSIMRWWNQWGSDTAFFEAVGCELPELIQAHSFDVLYPDLDLQATFDLASESAPQTPAEKTDAMHEGASLSGTASFSAPLEQFADRSVRFIHPGLTGDGWDE